MGLKIAELFHSIQGEGPTAGRPALFVRFAGCILNCKWCDTVDVWSRPGTDFEPEALALHLLDTFPAAVRTKAHLIVTGGSPLRQGRLLGDFLEYYRAAVFAGAFVEVETEGVLIPTSKVVFHVNQWNVSLKLSSSEEPEEKRLNADAIEFHKACNSFFKFVVADRHDFDELLTLIEKYRLPRERIWLMPCASDNGQLIVHAPKVAEWCKEYGFCYSHRLQVAIWNKTTGV